MGKKILRLCAFLSMFLIQPLRAETKVAIFLAQEDYAEALKQIDAELKVYPDNLTLKIHKVTTLLALKREEQALVVFEKIPKKFSSNSDYAYCGWLVHWAQLKKLPRNHKTSTALEQRAAAYLRELLEYEWTASPKLIFKAQEYLKDFPNPKLSKEIENLKENP